MEANIKKLYRKDFFTSHHNPTINGQRSAPNTLRKTNLRRKHKSDMGKTTNFFLRPIYGKDTIEMYTAHTENLLYLSLFLHSTTV